MTVTQAGVDGLVPLGDKALALLTAAPFDLALLRDDVTALVPDR